MTLGLNKLSTLTLLMVVFCCHCDAASRQIRADKWPDFANGEGGVKWKLDCDFPGYDISWPEVSGEICGRLCVEKVGCNAFRHTGDTCYLKNIPVWLTNTPVDGGMCGFLPWEFLKKE